MRTTAKMQGDRMIIENADRDVTSSDLDLMLAMFSVQAIDKQSGKKYLKSWQQLEFLAECGKQGIPTKACLQGIKLLKDAYIIHTSETDWGDGKIIYFYKLHIIQK